MESVSRPGADSDALRRGKLSGPLGLDPAKADQKAYEQRPEAVQAWLDIQYPAIARRAHTEDAEIRWGDETGLRSDDVRGRSYAPRGQTPEIRVPQRRASVSVISTVTNCGTVRWKVFEGAMHAGILRQSLNGWRSMRRPSKCFICHPTARS